MIACSTRSDQKTIGPLKNYLSTRESVAQEDGHGALFQDGLGNGAQQEFPHRRMSIRSHDEQAGVPLSNLFKNRLTHRIHRPQSMCHRVDPVEPQEFNCPFGLAGSLLTVVVRAENADFLIQVQARRLKRLQGPIGLRTPVVGDDYRRTRVPVWVALSLPASALA